MRYENNNRLREYLDRGAAGAYREHLRHPRFEFNEEAFAAALDQVLAQFPDLAPEDAEARAAFRLLTSGVAPEVAVPLPSRWYRARAFLREKSVRSWPWLKLAWAVAVLFLCVTAVALLSALVARAEPTPQNMAAYRNAMRGLSLLAPSPALPQQPGGIIVQFKQSGSTLATRPAGLVTFNCSIGMSCSFSGTTFTLTSTGAGGSGCTPPGTPSNLLCDDGAGGCLDSGLTWSCSTATAPSGVTLTYSGAGIINARNWAGTGVTNTESLGKIPIGNGDGTASWSDPFVSGITPHDAVGTSTNPVLIGGYASAAAPSDVSADGDATRMWVLRNGSPVVNLAAGGALIPGDATNGLKVQVTTAPTTTVTATNLSTNIAQIGGGNTQVTTNGLNSTGTGILAQALVGQLDDVTPNTCTENQFCNARISSKGVLYGQIRDAAGNERGANVTAANALVVDGSAVTQPVSGTVGITANSSVNVNQVAGTAIGTPNTFGTTAPTGNALGVNASLFVGTSLATSDGTAGALAVGGHFANNSTAAATNKVPVMIGIAQTSYANGTAYTQGRDVVPDVFTDGALHVAALPAMRPASYRASASYAGSSTTDNFRMPGNASNTVLITYLSLTCTQTTAGVITVTVNKRSTAGSSGTSANATVVPMDSNYAAGSSVPVSYTGTGPTVGTLVGQIDAQKIGCNATGTAGPNDVYVLNLRQKPIVLRGTAENLVINLGGAITGGNLTTTVEWIETATITP